MDLVRGFLTYVALLLAPLVVLLTARHWRRLLERLARLLRRVGLRRRRPEVPAGLPLEVLAADLRRLYAGAHHPRPGVRMPKQRGVLMAYDERLVQTARALGVATTLPDCPIEGFDRAAERIRLEQALADAGLVWRAEPGLGSAA